jgi:hypothetical protein
MQAKIISNANCSQSEEDPNMLEINIESESKRIYYKEFSLNQLIQTCSIFKKFETIEIFDIIQNNCDDKSIKFVKNDYSMNIELKVSVNKKDLTTCIHVPLKIEEKQKKITSEDSSDFMISNISMLNDKVNELSLIMNRKYTNVIQCFPELNHDYNFDKNNATEKHFPFKYVLDNSKYVHFILDSTIFYSFNSSHYQICAYLELKNLSLNENNRINFFNMRCLESNNSNYTNHFINKTRTLFMIKGDYEMNLVFKKNSSSMVSISDLNLCLLD